MRIVILGRNGQVGSALLQQAQAAGDEITAWGRAEVDAADPAAVRKMLQQHVQKHGAPDALLNAVAYNLTAQAEDEPAAAAALNTELPGLLAQEAALCGAAFVHYSTDYVFDGLKAGPYSEDDAIAPLSVYGRSKACGEAAVQQAGGRSYVLRTAWVYSETRINFAKTVLQAAQEKEELSMTDNEFGTPTPAALIAQVTLQLLRKGAPPGIYHTVTRGAISRLRYAELLLQRAREQGVELRCRRLIGVPAAAGRMQRPQRVELSPLKAETFLHHPMPNAEAALAEFDATAALRLKDVSA